MVDRSEWSEAELETLLNIDEKREWLREAWEKRIAIPTLKGRLSARMSDFLTNHQVAWCWFIHDLDIPICKEWEREEQKEISHSWEVRVVYNDVSAGPWQAYPEAGSTVGSLVDLLTKTYGRDPELCPFGWNRSIVGDFTRRYQYRCVKCPPLKLPTKAEVSALIAQAEGRDGAA